MENIFKKIEEEEVEFIDLEFTDIFGLLKTIEIPSSCLKEAIERGVWFDGSSIKGYSRTKESDMFLKPDISTFAITQENENIKTARFFCDVYTPEGNLFTGDPRTILKKVIKEAEEEGFFFKTGPEVEFYLFEKEEKKLIVPEFDTGSYFDSPVGDLSSKIRKEIMLSLKNYGIMSERAHHEVGKGQHEIGIKYDDALVTADRVITLKKIIKTIAHKRGLRASFMPKPFSKKAGNGMHIHFSLFNAQGNSLFFDDNDTNKLSTIAKSFIAGQLHYIKETTAIMNPTVNSYKRLIVGYEAPVYICWGSKNRSALVRVPRYTKGKESSVRAEIRSPDPSCSPYLAFAAILKAGLEGIKQNMTLLPEAIESVFENNQGFDILPRSLNEAISYLERSEIMISLFGQDFLIKYVNAKKKEIEDFRTHVTDWETSRYMESC